MEGNPFAAAYLDGAVTMIDAVRAGLNTIEVNNMPEVETFRATLVLTMIQMRTAIIEAFEADGVTYNG